MKYNLPNINLKGDIPRIIPPRSGLKWPSDFSGFDEMRKVHDAADDECNDEKSSPGHQPK